MASSRHRSLGTLEVVGLVAPPEKDINRVTYHLITDKPFRWSEYVQEGSNQTESKKHSLCFLTKLIALSSRKSMSLIPSFLFATC